MSVYLLYCQLENDPDGAPFPIEIDPNKTVGQLKEYIKEKNPDVLEHVNARRLVLWKVGPKQPIKNAASNISMLISWCFERWTHLTTKRSILRALLLKMY